MFFFFFAGRHISRNSVNTQSSRSQNLFFNVFKNFNIHLISHTYIIWTAEGLGLLFTVQSQKSGEAWFEHLSKGS